MTEPLAPPPAEAPAPAAPTASAPATAAANTAASPAVGGLSPWPWLAGAGLLALVALGLAWQSDRRVRDLEQELVRRQSSSNSLAQEARQAAKSNAEQLREQSAKLALAEARVAELVVQRSQVEELLQSVNRSRDENILADLESSLRLAAQQTALVGNAEPLIAALRQADERLQRLKQARLESVRRAVQRDLERVRAIANTDPGTLALRLDEVARMVDELPLVSEPQRQQAQAEADAARPPLPAEGWARWRAGSLALVEQIWSEARGLLRISRVDDAQAMLLAPEQAFFLRETLKLRLLNARLALLSRQYDTAQHDLGAALAAIERHADRRQRRVQTALELLRQVQAQAKPVQWPRPDDSLAALSTATGVSLR